jgi:NAD(P)-dependent dehydrogenase (short-subunit alcohol dehydrogenase family)
MATAKHRPSAKESPKQPATDAATRQRRAQRGQDRRDAAQGPAAKSKAAVQAGARPHPVQPPAQHIGKPSHEHELKMAPQFEAPQYLGSHKLAERVALITGGDSGIGRAVAVLFAREGADVAIVYLNEHEDARRTQEAVEREGRRCLLIPGDVQKPAFCARAVRKVMQQFGRLDVLVNNAAFQEHAASIEELSEERFDLTLKTNVYGYFHMAKAALPHLQAGAAIINTGSVTGLEGEGHLLDYSTTKGAIHAFTKSLASNLLPRGIRVNAVAPGPVWTPLNPADKAGKELASFGRHTDMKRAAQPEELSPAYVFLASPVCSGYISGIVLPVTGSVGAI